MREFITAVGKLLERFVTDGGGEGGGRVDVITYMVADAGN